MPRNELNNPTERIGRLLAEFEEFLQYISEYEDWIRPHVPPEILISAPSRPVPIEFELEHQRRSLSHHKPWLKTSSVKNVLANRLSQRRSRELKSLGYSTRSRNSYLSVNESEIAAAIEKEFLDPIEKNTTVTIAEERAESEGIADILTPHKQGSALTLDDIARLKREIEEQ